MTVYDKLMRILEHTSSDVLDEMWHPDMSLDEIAGELLDDYLTAVMGVLN